MSSAVQTVTLGTRSSSLLREYAELFKARVSTLIVLTAWCGAYLAGQKSGNSLLSPTLLSATLGIALVAGGTAGLNEVIERKVNAKMRRTCMRPLVTGTISVCHALAASIAMVLAGCIYLGLSCNWFSALLAFSTSIAYLCAYTPMKTIGPTCTFIGAFPGAMPPVLGWVAVRGRLDWEALALFAIMFCWQFPHFHSIALLYREDYERAGIKMLAVVDQKGEATERSILGYSLALIPASLAPTLLGMSGWIYLVSALLLGLLLLWCATRIRRSRILPHKGDIKLLARQLLKATVFYLPALFALMLLDRRW